MPGTVCAHATCGNCYGKGITLHRFPKDPERRARWVWLMRREGWSPKSCDRVCSVHFKDTDFDRTGQTVRLHQNVEPSIFELPPHLQKMCKEKQTQNSGCKRPYASLDGEKASSFTDVQPLSSITNGKRNKQSNMKTDEIRKKRRKEMTSRNRKATSSNTTLLTGKDIEVEWPNLADLRLQHRQLQEAYTNLQAEVDTVSAENDRLKEDLHRVLPRFSYSSVKGDHEQILFLTGVPSLVFDWLVSQVTTYIEGVDPELTSRDHLLMILMKLKLGVCDTDLAYRFGTQDGLVTRICQSWLPALGAVLKPLIAWQSVETVLRSRPSVFRGEFRRCRCIIDCLEFVVARVGENGETQDCTVRYFVSVTPAGAVSFLSTGYSSVIPERQAIKESGFLQLVERQDEILANRQIPIRDELASLGSALHTPDPNDGKQTQRSDFKKQFDHIWTHVRKVNGWWKEFCMLEKVIQEPYADLLDDILIVCAALTNVNMSVAPKGNGS